MFLAALAKSWRSKVVFVSNRFMITLPCNKKEPISRFFYAFYDLAVVHSLISNLVVQ